MCPEFPAEIHEAIVEESCGPFICQEPEGICQESESELESDDVCRFI